MKKYIIAAFAVAIAVISCDRQSNKIAADDQRIGGEEVTICANINNEDLKSDYTISGSTAYFHWTGTEQIGRLYRSGNFGQDAYTSTTSADNEETSLYFSGYQDGTSTDYAFYPKWTNATGPGMGWRSNPFDLFLGSSLAYDSANPLKNVVPMIGKLVNGEFDFVPVVGIVALTVKNLPEAARSITLSSDVRISAYYRLTSYPDNYASNLDWVRTNGLTVGIANNAATESWANTKTFSFSDGLDRGEHTFYFPVSVGTLTNPVFQVKDGSGNVLQQASSSSSITTAKGKISRLSFVMDLAKATKFAFGGDAASPYIYCTAIGPEVSAKVAVAATEEAALAAVASSENVISAAGVESKYDLGTGLTVSGKYYAAYAAVTESGEVLLSGTKEFYYITADHVSAYIGDYDMKHSGGTTTLTMAVSDNWTKGNVKLVSFDGVAGGQYGCYQSDKASTNLVFANSYNVSFAGSKYIYSSGSNLNMHFGFNGSSSANYDNTTWDLICWNASLIFEYSSEEKYYFNYLRGNRHVDSE